MSDFLLKLGLDLPLTGSPEQKIYKGPNPSEVAVVAADFNGLKPKMLIEEGENVDRGTPLFCHKDQPGVLYVSPAKGKIKSVCRGSRRLLQSVIVDVSDADDPGPKYCEPTKVGVLTVDDIRTILQKSGLWISFLTRPYSKVPEENGAPIAIFVNAMESEPLSPDASLIIKENPDAFCKGVEIITKLTTGKTYVCKKYKSELPTLPKFENIEVHSFGGPHPSGLTGTHMHFLNPPSANKTMWSVGYQDAIAIGELFKTGYLSKNRIVALAGPMAKNPRLLEVMNGSSLSEIVRGETTSDLNCRIISGSILTGRNGEGAYGYLGRYARQISMIEEDTTQIPFGWIRPQGNKYSVMPVLISAFQKSKLFEVTSNLNGGRRAMVPTGVFESLMPQDYLPTQLLRSLLVMDTDTAQNLGALELDEEDVALCTFACPAKYEYGQALRESLQKIEKEG